MLSAAASSRSGTSWSSSSYVGRNASSSELMCPWTNAKSDEAARVALVLLGLLLVEGDVFLVLAQEIERQAPFGGRRQEVCTRRQAQKGGS